MIISSSQTSKRFLSLCVIVLMCFAVLESGEVLATQKRKPKRVEQTEQTSGATPSPSIAARAAATPIETSSPEMHKRVQESTSLRDAVIGAISGGLFVVFGSIIAYILTERATRRREARNEEKQKSSIRTLLSLEIAHNLKELQNLKMAQIDLGLKPDESDAEELRKQRVANAEKLVRLSTITWDHLAWQSQLAFIPSVLTTVEVEQVFAFHSRLEAITTIQNTLRRLKTSQDSQISQAQIASHGQGLMHPAWWTVSRDFDQMASTMWLQFVALVDEILNLGNPLDLTS